MITLNYEYVHIQGYERHYSVCYVCVCFVSHLLSKISASGQSETPRYELSTDSVFVRRKNKRLFEASSLHLLLQEMHRTCDRSQAFISMNLSSILLNLGMLTRS